MCPDDSNGIYNVPNGTLVNSGDTVLPSQHNPWANDSATAISNRYSKDGRAPLTGNMNVNGFLIRNLGTPTANADAATKQYADNANPNNIYTLVAVNTAVGVADKGRWYRTSTAGIVFTPASAATLGANHFFRVKNDSPGIVIIDPTGSETINGALTVALNPGSEAYVICDGANFWASIVSQQASGPDYVQGLTLSNNAVDAANDIDVAVGSAKSGSRVVSLASVFTKRLDANWAAGTGNGGLDTGSKANSTTYRVWPLRNLSTGAFDAIFSTSTTPGGVTVPSGYEVIAPRDFDVGMILTDGSGNILPFIQTENDFYWNVVQSSLPNDLSTTTNRAKALLTCRLPTGRRVKAHLQPTLWTANADASVVLTIADGANISVEKVITFYASVGVKTGGQPISTFSNTSSQVYAALALSTSPSVTASTLKTLGWCDYQIPRV